MYERQVNSVCRLHLILLISYALNAIIMKSEAHAAVQGGYQSAGFNFLSRANKMDNKLTPNDDIEAERTFHQFIHSNPESTVIAELKPNSSDLELMLIKEKIASSILSIQELEKQQNAHMMMMSGGNDCFIEVTRVDRVAGKCHKVNNGLPVCQTNGYLAINTEECG